MKVMMAWKYKKHFLSYTSAANFFWRSFSCTKHSEWICMGNIIPVISYAAEKISDSLLFDVLDM